MIESVTKGLLFIFFFLGFTITGFNQSKNITLQSNWNGSNYEYNDVWGYTDYSGKEYAIIGSKTKVHFIDVSRPNEPILVAEFALGSNTSWRDIKTYDHYAYAVSEGLSNEGLVIFDLCEIEEGIIEIVYQEKEVFGKAHNIFIDSKKGTLYVVGANTQADGIIVFDLAENPANPSLLTKRSMPGGYIHDFFIKDNLGFCSHGYSGLYIYDFTNPSNPIPKAFLQTGGYNHSSWGLNKENLILYAQEVPLGLPLGILDYTNYLSNDIETVKTFKAPLLGPNVPDNTPHNPYVVGDYAVVSYYEDGVVIFDMSDPLQPDTVAYYDTYPQNDSTYTGYNGCWGVYPFLPSGNILASDISNGLFVLKPSFDLPSTCNNGVQEFNESATDCGGVCQLCTPCIKEICGNGIDDNRDGKTDCEDEICDCPGSQTQIQIKIMLEGFLDKNTGLMSNDLWKDSLLPEYQPFKTSPFYYAGREQITEPIENIVDWVLVEARHPVKLDSVLSKKAAILLMDGSIVQADGLEGIQFETISSSSIHLVVRHKGHLAVMSREEIDLSSNLATYDFTLGIEKAMGINQQKLKGNYATLYAGDFDQNGIINNLDFNIWKQNSALVSRYLFWDVDGNGLINNLDFNFWKLNRSKIGEPMVKID